MGGKSRGTSREIANTDKPFIALWVGFLMLMVTPCTDWYLVFTAVAKGNLALSTALLPVPLVLVVGPLIELPVLAVISQILLWMEPKRMRI
jgi:ACR3 family arsenite efflux pump ArsB